MGVDRGAESEAVAEQVLADGGARSGRSGAVGRLPAHRRQPLAQLLVDVHQLLAERRRAIGRRQRER